ncbi:thioredoxin TrxC [Pinisolibacter aquiterrae]|uniref:thioredoxin TrxC n=1 Tax=Pinisolibacter aquiterrae TaxID=2815579 RepID=UPI001C3E03F1|nr:thioredoxin TrxC [Pinisolibacter aquiterrae]MBV5262519.1 thioredoxin TrxC [Pinisolibacter aquiterrae]MCC8236530.1 thioredoxin TrxC [Pinisolibacter aquiterrae]
MHIHAVCPQCGTINRLVKEKLDTHWREARCPSCRAPLFPGRPIGVDGAGLARHVERSDVPLLVDFWAPWCGPCKMMAPAFQEVAALLEPKVRLLKLDTEADPDAGARWGIRSIPTLVLLDKGREVARQSGAMSAPQILRWIEGHGVR